MERKRPTASNAVPVVLTCLDGGRKDLDDGPLLTRAEANALRRSAALTHTELRRHLGPVPDPPLRSA
ncbi:MAG: hypothetical protein QOJ89_375 [bacterium]